MWACTRIWPIYHGNRLWRTEESHICPHGAPRRSRDVLRRLQRLPGNTLAGPDGRGRPCKPSGGATRASRHSPDQRWAAGGAEIAGARRRGQLRLRLWALTRIWYNTLRNRHWWTEECHICLQRAPRRSQHLLRRLHSCRMESVTPSPGLNSTPN